MPEQPTIYDRQGHPISGSSLDGQNLPVGVQALIEARVNTAISQIKDHNRADLKELELDHKKNWRILKVLSSFIMIFGIVTAFYAPAKIAKSIKAQVDKNFTEPKIKESADRIITAKMSAYVDQKLEPLNEQSAVLYDSLDAIRDDVEKKQNSLKLEQLKIAKQLNIRQLAISTQAGSRKAYSKLLAMQDDPEQSQSLLTASLKEIDIFYQTDRKIFGQLTLVRGSTMKNPGFTVDEIMYELYKKPQLVEAAINTLSKLKEKGAGTICKLCELVAESDDLHVVARATNAIQKFTGIQIQPLDFKKIAEWWEENSTTQNYNGSYAGYINVVDSMWSTTPVTTSVIDQFIRELETTISSDPETLHSRCLKAGFLLMRGGKDEEAKALLDEVRTKNSGYHGLYVWDAAFCIKTNNIQKAVKLINKAILKSGSQEIERTIKHWKIFDPILSNEDINWSNQKS